MTEKYKILGKYIKDLSSETPDAETYIYVRERISKYCEGINVLFNKDYMQRMNSFI